MESRKIAPSPVSDERQLKVKRDDFEPQLTSGGPVVVDRPVPPPNPFDIDTSLPCPPPEVVEK